MQFISVKLSKRARTSSVLMRESKKIQAVVRMKNSVEIIFHGVPYKI